MDDPCSLPAHELLRLTQSRALSCEEVMRAHLDRIDAVNPSLNALVQACDPDECLAQARAADERIATGLPLGRLEGLPTVVKDVLDIEGMICSGGSRHLAYRATRDATVVTRLRGEGAILLGLANVPEMSRGGESNNGLYGRTNNPYDLMRTPGGSSGGAAALVASSAAAVAIGSDGGGSVRQPCHCTGIAGLKPTHGRIPRSGSVFGDSLGIFGPFVSYGPMARTVDDVALTLPVVSGPDGLDAYAVPAPLGDPAAVDLAGLRVAFFTDDGVSPPTPETAAVVTGAAQQLEPLVAGVEEDRPECLAETMRLLWETVFLGGDHGREFEEELGGRGAADPSEELGEFLRQARLTEFTITELRSRLGEIDAYRLAWATFMDGYDVLVCPAMPTPAKPHGHGLNEVTDFSYMMAHNLTGWPAAVVRCGTSAGGLPIGVQVVAKPWQEHVALAAAKALEDAFGGWQPPGLLSAPVAAG